MDVDYDTFSQIRKNFQIQKIDITIYFRDMA